MKAIQRKEGFELRDNIIYFKGKLYVPVSNRRDLVEESDNLPVARHDGVEATAARLGSFWWPKMKQLIHEVVASCEACQRRKVERRAPAGRMEEHEAFEPMAVVAFDVLGPLPETLTRRKFVLVGVDHFSRFMVAKPMTDQTAAKFVELFMEFCANFGIPSRVITDNARNFDNSCFKSVLAEFNVEHTLAVAGHHRGNAICERSVQSLADKLAMVSGTAEARAEWDASLPTCVLSINTKVNRSTGYSPFEFLYGRKPPELHEAVRQAPLTPYDLYMKTIRLGIEAVRREAVARSFDPHWRNKLHFDQNRRQRHFEIDDLVLISLKVEARNWGPSSKVHSLSLIKEKTSIQSRT